MRIGSRFPLARPLKKCEPRSCSYSGAAGSIVKIVFMERARNLSVESTLFLLKYDQELRNTAVPDEPGITAECNSPRSGQPMPQTPATWSPPLQGTIKINTDAAHHCNTGTSAADCVARDSKGKVILSVCKALPNCSSVEEAEARAILVGCQSVQW